MNADLRELTESGFEVDQGLKYTGSADNYLYMLKRYYTHAGKLAETISESLVSDDIATYTRAVHSLKGNSKMIGAAAFAENAEELEQMAKAGNKSGMLEKTPELLQKLSYLCAKLEPYAGIGGERPEGILSGEEALKTGRELLRALNDYDDTKAKDLTQKLMGYPFRTRQKNILKSVLDEIAEYNYDEAAREVIEVLGEVDNQL